MVNTVLFPSSYFDVMKVDEDLQKEYEAVLSTGLFNVVLFGYDKWFNEGKLVIRNKPSEECLAVYRGWMMKPEQYEQFYIQLLDNNIRLITEPQDYQLMHVFPNVYDFVKEDTARMEIFPLHEQLDVEYIKKRFGRFMVKDFVKSVKGTDFPKFFNQDITQAEFDNWMDVFYKYRGPLLTGGICIKEFLDLKRYGEHTNEYRVFYMNHNVATICRNSGQGSYTPEPPMELIEKYRNLSSPYYTIDYAELTDGSWKILEAGDGEVSGLSDYQDYKIYFRTLYHCFL